MLASNCMTFEEAKTSDLFTMVPRSRLHIIRKGIFDQLDTLPL